MKKFKFSKVSIVILAIAFTLGLGGSIAIATLAPGTVDLGTADNFAILAGSAITDANPIGTIDGDVGLGPDGGPNGGADITGLLCAQLSLTSTLYDNDAGYAGGGLCRLTDAPLLTAAKADLETAYNFAAAQGATTIGTDLAAAILSPGVYDSADTTFDITGGGTLTLDGENNPDAVFIFKMDTTLNTSGASNVTLINGAQACNVFWQVGTSATFGAGTDFVGTVMAAASINDASDSTIIGRLLADADDDGTGAVTISNTDVTVPTCAPSLTLNKTVVNTGGGTADDTDWTLTAVGAGGTPLSGTDPVNSNATYNDGVTFFEADTYTLAESGGPADYTASLYSCETNGEAPVPGDSIILAAGDDAICTITNTYIPPVIPPVVRHSSVIGSIARAVVSVFEPSITILSTPVVVTPIVIPTLPVTGFPPQSENTSWYKVIQSFVLNFFK